MCIRDRLFFQRFKGIATAFRFRRQEAFITETVGRQASGAQGGDSRTRTRQRHDADIGFAAGTHQMIAWVVNQRRARIGDLMKIDKSFIPITVYSSMIQFLILQKLYMIPINTEENTSFLP